MVQEAASVDPLGHKRAAGENHEEGVSAHQPATHPRMHGRQGSSTAEQHANTPAVSLLAKDCPSTRHSVLVDDELVPGTRAVSTKLREMQRELNLVQEKVAGYRTRMTAIN